MPESVNVGVVCGRCGSGDIYMLACPEHEWCVGSICHGCQSVCVVGDGDGWREPGHCPECGWPKEGAVR